MSPEPAIHVIDDDKAVRRSIAFLLAANAMTVRVYESGRGFLDMLSGEVAGCVLCDVRMPEMDGIELLRTMRSRGIHLPFVIMTGHADVAMAVQAMKEGAMDFIEKPFEDTTLLSILRHGLEQGQAEGRRTQRRAEIQDRVERLTPRERQILELVAAGKQNKIIAHELGISPRTVEVHRANLIEKVQARNTSDLIAIVLELARR